MLAAHVADRDALCDALADLNASWGAGAETLEAPDERARQEIALLLREASAAA